MEGPGRLAVAELPLPAGPPPGGAVVRVLANGICGSDWDLYSGVLTQLRGRPVPFPLVPGHEPIGVIESIDAAATEAWGVGVGDRVAIGSTVTCGQCEGCRGARGAACRHGVTYSMISVAEGPGLWGGLAQHMVLLPGSCVVAVPDDLADADAALFNPLANAIHWSIERGGVGLGDDVLVLGSGQRGLCCVIAAKAAGARKVLVTGLASDRHKLDLAMALGATATIVADEEDVVARAQELTGGEGVDVVVDTVPGAVRPIYDGVEALRLGGTLVVAGLRSGPADGFPLELFRSKQLHMVGASATTPRAVQMAIDMLARSDLPLDRFHTHVLGLDDSERAMRLLGGCEPDESPIHVLVVPT